MEATFIFLLKVSGCLAIFYGAYLLIFRNDTNFKIQRFYLIASVGLSIIMPFNNYALRQYNSVPTQESISAPAIELQNQETVNQKWANQELKISLPNNFSDQEKSTFSLTVLLKWLYISIAALLLFRIISGLLKFCALRVRSRCDEIFHTRVFITDKINGSANIFGVIFLNPSLTNDPKLSQIILHEKIHASQYHSIDILLAELLAAAMWFNPVVWFMRRSLQQIHEYLADDGVLRSGVNRLEYQKLLINHIAEDSLALSSGFKSSIKKRFFMMTKSNETSQTKSKVLTLLPLTAILIAGISFINAPAQEKQPVKQATQVKFVPPQTSTSKNSKAVPAKTETQPQQKVKFEPPVILEENAGIPQEPPVAAVSLSAMNVMYLGVDNPVTIAVANYNPKEIKVTLSNGTLIKADGGYYNYIARPKEVGMTILSVFAGEKLINKSEFRVKRVPDPVAKIGGKKGGLAKTDFLLAEDEIKVDMENFDFNLKFEVTEFTMSTHNGEGFLKDLHSKSNKITPEQKELIAKAKSGQKIYFLDIKCAGPDGGTRDLSPIVFKIL